MRAAFLFIALISLGTLPARAAETLGTAELLKQARALFLPLPKTMATRENPITPAKAELGRKLFFDPRFSLDGTVSCMRCHQAGLYATDGLPKAIGVKDRVNPRNSPTVLNAALQISAHWRGDRTSVEDQATQSLTGPGSFGNPDPEAALSRIKAIPGYARLFADAFPGERDPITLKNFGLAVGAFERTLVSPAPFDRFLQGKTAALSQEARTGLGIFIAKGCAGCHNGVGIGGGSYQKFGVTEEYWNATGSKEIDRGRADVTQKPEDEYVFKVPSLRNVARTAPYFHDGSVASLRDAIAIMGRVQLGKTLTPKEIRSIEAFLDTLTGEIPASLSSAPILPSLQVAGKFEATTVPPKKAAKTTDQQQ